MQEYKLKCAKCGLEYAVPDDGNIPLYNKAKKRDWAKSTCPKCNVVNRIARATKSGNLLYAWKNFRLD